MGSYAIAPAVAVSLFRPANAQFSGTLNASPNTRQRSAFALAGFLPTSAYAVVIVVAVIGAASCSPTSTPRLPTIT